MFKFLGLKITGDNMKVGRSLRNQETCVCDREIGWKERNKIQFSRTNVRYFT